MPASATAPSPRLALINACRRDTFCILFFSFLKSFSRSSGPLEPVSELVRIRQRVHHVHKSRGSRSAQFLRLLKSSGSGHGFAGCLLLSNRLFLRVQERFERVFLPGVRRTSVEE